MTTVEYAQKVIDILSPIPDEDFGTGQCYNAKTGKCCSWGHVDKARFGNHEATGDDQMMELIRDLRINMLPNLFDVNDMSTKRYPQRTPKQRVLALLTDYIKLKSQ